MRGMEHESAGRFEVAVIGLGLIGSAACRHLALSSDSVVGIGPQEPRHWKSHMGVFASHYDEARLTRIVDKDDVWSKLAARSILSYAGVEEESGVKFHHPAGSLRVTPFYQEDGDSLVAAFHSGRRNGAPVELIESGAALKRRFPYFRFEERHAGVMEAGGAGYVNPRAMVKAQLQVAGKHGAEIVPETAVKIEPTEDGFVSILTDTGRILFATKVLLCTDAYTNLLLGPERAPLALTTYLVSVLLAEVDTADAAKLNDMPSIIWRLSNHPYFHSVYACPPVLYPDGKTYLKIGGTEWKPHSKSSPEDFVEWFHSNGRPVETKSLQEILVALLPETPFKSFSRKSCIVTYTAHNYPYIAAVDGKSQAEAQVFVCTGGCGAAAKSSDEIGRIGALLVAHRTWSSDFDERLFKCVRAEADERDAKMVPHI